MTFQVRTESRPVAAGHDGTIVILEEPEVGAKAEIWPGAGFNCFRWQTSLAGRRLDLLYSDPHFLDNFQPTRRGIPILFPFPNRIRDGRFQWEGKAFQLPLNDSTKQNAIHGFACRRPWRLVAQGADTTAAWVTGEFWGSKDAPETRSLWPADYRIRVTYRLAAHHLRLEARV